MQTIKITAHPETKKNLTHKRLFVNTCGGSLALELITYHQEVRDNVFFIL